MMKVSEEIIDVVDFEDRVIGRSTRREIHQKSLLHRAVHILVFNLLGEIYIQKRVWSKDENPGLWDSSAAGHVESGEDYNSCAQRELMEELKIQGNLKSAGKLIASPKTSWEHVKVYTCVTNQFPIPDPSEILEGNFKSIQQIKSDLKSYPEKFTPTFKEIIGRILLDPSEIISLEQKYI